MSFLFLFMIVLLMYIVMRINAIWFDFLEACQLLRVRCQFWIADVGLAVSTVDLLCHANYVVTLFVLLIAGCASAAAAERTTNARARRRPNLDGL